MPPFDASQGHYGTSAAVEFSVIQLGVREIVVYGHSHFGAIRALKSDVPAEARQSARWRELG